MSEERDLVVQAERATSRGEYVRLRELADGLVEVAERRASRRAALVEAVAQESAGQAKLSGDRQSVDQASDTWRQLR